MFECPNCQSMPETAAAIHDHAAKTVNPAPARVSTRAVIGLVGHVGGVVHGCGGTGYGYGTWVVVWHGTGYG